jgi:hypothetical protein
MSSEEPPIYYFNGINFNNSFFNPDSNGISEAEANGRYLRKKTVDTATALENFNAGINTTEVNPISTSLSLVSGATDGRILNLMNASEGTINIGTNASGSNLFINSENINIGQPSGASTTNIRSLTTNVTNGVKTDSINSLSNTLTLQSGTTDGRILNIMDLSEGTINLGTNNAPSLLNLKSNDINIGVVGNSSTTQIFSNTFDVQSSTIDIGTSTSTLTINTPIITDYSLVFPTNAIGYRLNATSTTNTTASTNVNICSIIAPSRGIYIIEATSNPVFATANNYMSISLSVVSATPDPNHQQFTWFGTSGTISSSLTGIFTITGAGTTIYLTAFSPLVSTSNNNRMLLVRIA